MRRKKRKSRANGESESGASRDERVAHTLRHARSQERRAEDGEDDEPAAVAKRQKHDNTAGLHYGYDALTFCV